ncbi:zinc finger matrin-type protein 1 isoform X2 [Brienomyrus brachyistius]|uniref:zinc finger matrin-type protein 1 isoform X2 n=1 Tax=Brienomyrus brachyistius TaxID=42636 RepID=UPI0020B3ECBE|nr:zinc finger matrin-type protein 1 isoform X2 [Brienomyrus brachyistius]
MKMEPESVSIPQLAEAHIYKNYKCCDSNQVSASVSDAEKVKNTHNTNISQSEVSAAESSSELLKELLTDGYCHVCGAVLQFESQRVSHYEGKKHAQKVRLYLQSKRDEERSSSGWAVFQQKDGSVDKERFCELCNMVFSAPVVAKSHYEGKIHAKNLRRHGLFSPASDQQETDTVLQGSTVSPAGRIGPLEEKTEQGLELSDPDRHCHLCSASFNNPQVAKQHYAGRRHQRNQARQLLLEQMGKDGEPSDQKTSSFICPICCITLNSVEMYQAHMQGNKHQLKEKHVADLMSKSQKKVYSSFQDELADYIQVQKARGLEPRTTQLANAPEKEELQDRGAPFDGTADMTACEVNVLPPAHFPLPSKYPSFPPPPPIFGSGSRDPESPCWNQFYVLPGPGGWQCHRGSNNGQKTGHESSLERESSSSTYTSSSSSSPKDRRRLCKRRGRRRRGREQEGSEEESEEEDLRRKKKRHRKRSRRHEEGRQEEQHRAKRSRKEEKTTKEEKDGENEQVKAGRNEIEKHPRAQQEHVKEGKTKHKKDKKRAKERVDEIDMRTEEEKLWDESILGLL